MRKKRPEKGGIALFYSRDSGGQHETTPPQYVEWAKSKAIKDGLIFESSPNDISMMIKKGISEFQNLFFDNCVSGNTKSRPGLDSLLRQIKEKHQISHLFIPRRDRLMRPDNALDGTALEDEIRRFGITIVYKNDILSPIPLGQSSGIAEKITSLVEFDNSGKERAILAQKMIEAQISLARQGYSTGGRAPYGFRRWLVKVPDEIIRKLEHGEVVRMAGHHVVWLPEDREIEVVKRIVKLLKTIPASRVAKTLNEEEIPSPDSGRYRTDNGVRHKVSGEWGQTAITNIARNPLLSGTFVHGRRSMGDCLRHSAEGPRTLDAEKDYGNNSKPKVIANDEKDYITGRVYFESILSKEDHAELIKILDKRAGTQRGKSRSRDTEKSPLSTRIFDMNCTNPMYPVYPEYPVKKDGPFKYTCSLYRKGKPRMCHHNSADGPASNQLVLSCLMQKILDPNFFPKFRKRLEELACASQKDNSHEIEMSQKQDELNDVRSKLKTAGENLALVDTPDQREAIKSVFDKLKAKEKALGEAVEKLKNETATSTDIKEEVDKALRMAENLPELIKRSKNGLGKATELFKLVNANLFLSFEAVQKGKRKLNKVTGGVVTFGSAPFPIEPYSRTKSIKLEDSEKKEVNEKPTSHNDKSKKTPKSDVGGNSLTNVSRDDKI